MMYGLRHDDLMSKDDDSKDDFVEDCDDLDGDVEDS